MTLFAALVLISAVTLLLLRLFKQDPLARRSRRLEAVPVEAGEPSELLTRRVRSRYPL